MAAPNSAHTRPSQTANSAPAIHPSIACGPPIALTISGMVMNGPTPIMSIMLSAVALPRPIPRIRPGELEADSDEDPIVVETLLATSSHHADAASCVSTAGQCLSHSTNSHTVGLLRALLPATAGRTRSRYRCKSLCHTAPAAIRLSADPPPDHG